jgi:hypothetical protein
MSTFYSPLVRALTTPRERSTRKANHVLFEAWKFAWYDAGWDPKIVTLEGATRHPAYDTFSVKKANQTPWSRRTKQ